jgi:hypothetical protein
MERNLVMVWMRSSSSRSILAMVAVAVATLSAIVGAGASWAGEYHVYSCRTPDGEVAPTDGWSKTESGAFVYAEDKCAKGGALVAALGDGVEHEGSDIATWRFSAPSGESLVGATLWRAGNADGGVSKSGTYEFWLAGPAENEVLDECVYGGSEPCKTGQGEPEEPFFLTNRLLVSKTHLSTSLYVNAACFAALGPCKKGEHDPSGYAAVVYLYAADLTLEQASQPTVSDVQGELATAATLTGAADLSFHAQDSGSGVYQAVFSVDGVEVGHTVLEEDDGRCHDVGQSTDGLPAFLYLQPCPSTITADLPFETTTLTDGTHHLVVSVTDAAGNSTVVLDRKITVSNDPPIAPSAPSIPPQSPSTTVQNDLSPDLSPGPTPAANPAPTVQPQGTNGANATAAAMLQVHWSTSAKASIVGTFGRARLVGGRLTAPDGVPIADALIKVLDTPAYENAPTHTLTSVRTTANGSFHLSVPPSTPSSRLTFAYSSRPEQAVPDVSAALTLTVPASLVLSVAPRSTRIGGTILFSGTLHGSPLPPGGKQLVLEARTLTGPWRQFHVLSTRARGRFRASYRFRLPGPITYRFRAVSPAEADFPYGAGSSNVVSVFER